VALLNYCGVCAVPFPARRQPTQLGQERRTAFELRWEALQRTGASSTKTINSILQAFLDYMEQDGAERSLFAATPRDVVGFLVSKDARGQTLVHAEDCTEWGTLTARGAKRTCGCPKRASASAMVTTRGRLQGIFRDAGRSAEWCPQTRLGNPCISHEVKLFEKYGAKEQLAAGVRAVQSDLFDVTVYRHLCQTVLTAMATFQLAGDLLEALLCARDCFLYSLMWCSGFRNSDALRLCVQHIRPFGASNMPESYRRADMPRTRGWRLHVAVAKQAKLANHARQIVLLDDGSRFSVMATWDALCSALQRVHLTIAAGHVFRDVRPSEAESDLCTWADTSNWKDLTARFRDWQEIAGLPVIFSLQSFHGSCGGHDRSLGTSRAVTCAFMDWTPQMYDHYLRGREPWSLASLRDRVPP
jgi:hypothetical protein